MSLKLLTDFFAIITMNGYVVVKHEKSWLCPILHPLEDWITKDLERMNLDDGLYMVRLARKGLKLKSNITRLTYL